MGDRMKNLVDWLGDRRNRRLVAVAVIGAVLLSVAALYLFCPGGRLWYALAGGEEISTCLPKEGQYCIKYKDPGMSQRIVSDHEWAVACYRYPYSTEEYLFHSGLRFILYGEVKDIREYVLQGDSMRNGKRVKPVPYYCHVLTVDVESGVEGGIVGKRQVKILCKWKYHCEEGVDPAMQEEIAEGDHALFLVEGNAVRIRDLEKGEGIDVLGQVSGRLGGYVIESRQYDHLDRLGSRNEVISYYKKHGLLQEE